MSFNNAVYQVKTTKLNIQTSLGTVITNEIRFQYNSTFTYLAMAYEGPSLVTNGGWLNQTTMYSANVIPDECIPSRNITVAGWGVIADSKWPSQWTHIPITFQLDGKTIVSAYTSAPSIYRMYLNVIYPRYI